MRVSRGDDGAATSSEPGEEGRAPDAAWTLKSGIRVVGPCANRLRVETTRENALTDRRRKPSCSYKGSSRKRVFVSGSAVHDWNRHIEEAQIHTQLSAMVIPVVQHQAS